MGSWVELDARYPPEALTPATAFVVAVGHMVGATSVYANGSSAALADWLPRHGPDYDHDLLVRAERYLKEVGLEPFLHEACTLLFPRQKLCLALNLLDLALAARLPPDQQPRFTQLIEGLGMTMEQLRPYWQALVLKNDMSIFPQ